MSYVMERAMDRSPAGGAQRYLGAVQAGPRFCDLLSGVRRYLVHSVFARAINLWDGQEFLTLLPLSRGCGATWATVAVAPGESFLDFGLAPGLEVEARSGRWVRLGPEVVVDFGSALAWESKLAAVAVGDVRETHLRALLDTLLRAPAPSPIRGAIDGNGGPGRGIVALLDGLRASVQAADGARLGAALGGLVGFGPGLTPSGDDVVAGLCLARAVMRKACGKPDGFWEDAVREALGRTHALSGFLVREALGGRSHEFAEDALYHLLAGGPRETAHGATRLVSIGATSGFDMGVGIYLAAEWQRRYAWCSSG
ncbi:MAG: DUF2877 domain-containing protein [Bacillota bacterium]|nr:DUF2877 domain-containing protein [Bacillota bacterium]